MDYERRLGNDAANKVALTLFCAVATEGQPKEFTNAHIAQYWHKNQYGLIAGRLYIAWCAAAISLPVLAGALFDRTGSYASAAWIAAGINVLGALIALGLPARK